MKYDNQLRYASEIVQKYDGKIPLSAWLKNYFRLNKQMGSNDRKTVSEMVYGYYRLGGNSYSSIQERLLSFISVSQHISAVKEYFFSENKNDSLKNGSGISVDNLFPFAGHLSKEIDAKAFSNSFLQQPDLFLRLRPGKKSIVLEKLTAASVPFREIDENCIGLPNALKIENVLQLDKEAVVQDRSSQRTAAFLSAASKSLKPRPKVWDCCAASGGKSILAFDILDDPDITVSDIRESIIHNLADRFESAEIKSYSSFVADLTNPQTTVRSAAYDLVIADVPCTGSGTWARTPEQLYFFKEEKIAHYSKLQKKIVSRVIPAIKPGGYLLYITCSVFAEENEQNVDHFTSQYKLAPVKVGLIKGYNEKADTLFAALFTNQSA